jgi:pyruvate-ferredoxin/flavodoxin oxidoreductase
VNNADFIAVHNQTYLDKYDTVGELKHGGIFLLNCDWTEEELGEKLPAHVKRALVEKDASFYIIDANRISRELGLGDKASSVLQSSFFALANIVPVDEATGHMKDAIRETFKLKGGNIVEMNIAAVDGGVRGAKKIEIPTTWGQISCDEDKGSKSASYEDEPAFIREIARPITELRGDSLPVSVFKNCSDGTMPLGTTAYEKRGIATSLPVWVKENCIQCNRCSYVCPHAAIRPYLLDEAEMAGIPEGFETLPAAGSALKDLTYTLLVSDLDCTGCGCCANECPAKEKALFMVPADEKVIHMDHWEYGLRITEKEGRFDPFTIKGSQFKQPLCEFSGACAGCGETPYAKLLTQLFGDRMYWANATGCSQAWGSPMPSFPYTVNKKGQGPAWSNSLFEDNAEFAYGMLLATKQQRARVRENVESLKDAIENSGSKEGRPGIIHSAACAWLDAFNDSRKSAEVSDALICALKETDGLGSVEKKYIEKILEASDQLVKKTVWMYGGDGWAYDIGFGGLDHVLAMGEDINVFVVDTEVYSNTGGQSSKATPLGAVAQFQSSGKKSLKKDLGMQMIPYRNIYIASVAMGADPAQLVKALKEADEYPGPSLVIAYTPCIAHGIKSGMEDIQGEMKRAVESGYWSLYRYDPRKEVPFQLDSKLPTKSYRDFIEGEVRYSSLEISFPENAKELFAKAEEEAKKRYQELEKLAKP